MAKLKELADALARAQEAAKTLDEFDDQLSKMIPEYEEALKDLRLGVRIAVRLASDDGSERYLAFDKWSGGWRLLVEEGPDGGDPEDWSTTPLASVSRDERASVFEWHLDSLLESAAQQIETKIESRKATLEHAKERLAAIKALSGAKS